MLITDEYELTAIEEALLRYDPSKEEGYNDEQKQALKEARLTILERIKKEEITLA